MGDRIKSKISEEQITESICQFLDYLPNAQLNRIAPGGFFKGGIMVKHKSRYIKTGVSDIQLMHSGSFYVFEVKIPDEYKFVKKHLETIKITPRMLLSKKKKHIKDQWEYINSIVTNGGRGGFVCSIDQVKKYLQGHQSILID